MVDISRGVRRAAYGGRAEMHNASPAMRPARRVKSWVYTLALLGNALVFAFIGWVYISSDRSYTQKLFDENIRSVENMNAACANAAATYAVSMGVKADDIAAYIAARGMNYAQSAQYLRESGTHADWRYQLVKSGAYGEDGEIVFGDYTGISVRRTVRADGSAEITVKDVRYGGGYTEMLKAFTDVNDENYHGVCFCPEFTDPDTKQKCFAVYRHVTFRDESGRDTLYTLLLAVDSQTALRAYDVQAKYAGQSSVMVNAEGDYIIKNSDFRNVNFFDYIVNYNGLTPDDRQRLADTLALKNAPVNLYYRNHQGEDCVFSALAMENGWYSITCVPLSSFDLKRDGADASRIILILFVFLFAIDGVTIYRIGKTLRENVAVAEKATRDANEANRAKSRFLSTMSHELRTPLNAIIGLVALSRDSLHDEAVLTDYLKKMDISSKLLLQLISDILDVSAIESNKMMLNNGEFDITKLISSLSAIYYDQCAAKGIEFSVELKDMHAETLVGDSARVNQVLLNFLSNAVKYTPEGGRVTLSAAQMERGDARVFIRFEVRDTGCGIGEELRARLFMPFERASGEAARKYSGTGLGLSIAKNLTELMGGRVGVNSAEGAGSVFFAEIPFAAPPRKPRESFSPIANLRVLAAIRADGEREYIAQILSGFGIEYALADNAQNALSLLKARESTEKPLNLCLLDWKMDDLCALDAARQIRRSALGRGVRVIILAYNVAEASAPCADAGADLVLGKPVFPSALYNALLGISTGQARAVPAPSRGYHLAGKRVLLVEDNLLNTEIAKLLLNKADVRVETAQNGEIGFNAFAASTPGHFDAVLMDVQMPVMDGYQSARAIRNCAHPQAKTVPILAMTADAFTEDIEKAREAGMNEHISKPVVPEDLYAVLNRYLAGGAGE